MDNGATAIITATQIAIGYKNDNGFRIYGTKGSLEWHQEKAEKLLVRHGESDEIIGWEQERTKCCFLRSSCRHHEDFFEALANLHTTMERHIRRKNGESNLLKLLIIQV